MINDVGLISLMVRFYVGITFIQQHGFPMTSSPKIPSVDPVKLDRLAEVAIQIGLQLRPGQDLLITAPLAALPLVRRITEHAYKAGAGLVTSFYSDEEATLMRYRNAPDNSFDRSAGWLYEGMAKAFSANTARLAVAGDNPMLLSSEDPEKVARANKSQSRAYQPALEKIAGFDINWNIVSYPNPSWAKQMFPGEDPEVAVTMLADAIFAASRVDVDDPVAAWRDHNAALRKRTEWLNERTFSALHFKGPGTDLTVGLADEHEWHGGASVAKNGITCNPNIPTEEVFTTPHALHVDGHVSSTKPLSHQGTLIENIRVRFEGGKIVEAKATRGEEVFNKILGTDEGARRLGEVALVPHSSARFRPPACCSSTHCLMRTPRATSHSASAIRNASSMAVSFRPKKLQLAAATRASFTSTG